MQTYISRFENNVNHVFNGKSAEFRAQHQEEFDEISSSLRSHLMNELQVRTQADRNLVYTIHMAKFRRVARRIGLMKPRIRRKRR